MSERATGRHRATYKPSTPLSTLTGSLSVMGDYVGSVRRSGVIIAMSSGLVASMALPAQAVNAPHEAAGAATASIPVVPATGTGSALFTAPVGGLLALPPDLTVDTGTVTAPAAATVDFDHSAFTLEQPGGDQGSSDTRASVTVVDTDDEPDGDRSDGATGSDTRQVTKPPVTKPPVTKAPVTKPVPPKRKELRPAAAKAPAASKTADTTTSETATKVVPASASGSAAVAVAFRYQGTPYLWGGSSPRGFDCSGFTRYVYAQLGKELGRTVADQRGDVKFVPRSQAKPGDLVFFGTGHIGIYLGNNRMIDSPRRGKTIQAREIYSSNVQFGRVR